MDIQFVPESSQQCREVCPQQPQHRPGTQQVTESDVEHTQLAYRRPAGIARKCGRGVQNEWQTKDLMREEWRIKEVTGGS